MFLHFLIIWVYMILVVGTGYLLIFLRFHFMNWVHVLVQWGHSGSSTVCNYRLRCWSPRAFRVVIEGYYLILLVLGESSSTFCRFSLSCLEPGIFLVERLLLFLFSWITESDEISCEETGTSSYISRMGEIRDNEPPIHSRGRTNLSAG